MKTDSERTGGAAVAGAAPCSANLLRLQNETKIKFCNAWHEMQQHLGNCHACCLYLYHGDGDLCENGEDIIARKLAYMDTTPDWSPHKPTTGVAATENITAQRHNPARQDATDTRDGQSP